MNPKVCLNLLPLAAILVSCSHVPLVEDAEGIQIVSTAPSSNDCRPLGELSSEVEDSSFGFNSSAKDAQPKLLNEASVLGATHVVINETSGSLFSSSGSATGAAYRCALQASNEDLSEQCESNDSDACLDLSYRIAESNQQRSVELVNKACLLGNQPGCELANNIKFMSRAKELSAQCNGSANSCLELSFLYYQNSDRPHALQFAQKACVKGEKEGCNFYSKIMEENTALSQQNMAQQQMIMLQLQQNAVNQQRKNEQVQNALMPLIQYENSRKAQPKPQSQRCRTSPRSDWYGQTEWITECD